MDTEPHLSPRKARQIRMLQELAELAMALAREAQSVAMAAPTARNNRSFAQVARTVRQTLALEDRIAVPPVRSVRMPETAQRRDVKRLVERSITAENAVQNVESLRQEFHERLRDPDIEASFGHHSTAEIVLNICAQLGIEPDMSGWSDALLQEAVDINPEDVRAAGLYPDPPVGSPKARPVAPQSLHAVAPESSSAQTDPPRDPADRSGTWKNST